MDKFSLYDLLGLLLPGIILTRLINFLNAIFQLSTINLISEELDTGIGLLLCLGLMFGAILYASNFWLIKQNWYKRPTGIYKPVPELYLKMKALHKTMNATLNYKARKWFDKEIFLFPDVFNSLPLAEQEQLKEQLDEYYDRMYYELEYAGKIENAKTFQSFYFFFRQLFLACLVVILLGAGLFVTARLFPGTGLEQPETNQLISLAVGLPITLLLSLFMAQWYRKRMVKKMFWAYFTHLSQTLNS